MTSQQSMLQGIKAVQSGNHAEGERLLRYSLKDPALRGKLRATALNWLAEIVADHDQKAAFYNEALLADPQNDWAEEHLADLLNPSGAHHPPPPPVNLPESANPLVAPPPPAPIYIPASEAARPAPPPTLPGQMTEQAALRNIHVVGILGGPNGAGSGFFLTNKGMIVTTRYVTGALEQITVELEPTQQVTARVIRSFPDIDVALLQIAQPVTELLPMSPFDDIPANTPVTVLAYRQSQIVGRRRETGRSLALHLFPTDIVQLSDAGGGPVFNDQQQVVGMISHNISSSSAYVYGVHIAALRRCLETYDYELRSVAERVYCTSCGYASAAAKAGGFYCECCGTVMPHARDQPRAQTPHMAALYGENSYAACLNCGARVGYYDGLCLRCGHAGDPSKEMHVQP